MAAYFPINMKPDIAKLFHTKTKETDVLIPHDTSQWPETWKTIEFKEYKRFHSLPLPSPTSQGNLAEAIISRSSVKEWGEEGISLSVLSNLLYYSCGIVKLNKEKNNRAQGSAGGRYPLEIYIVNFIEGELKRGVYHYDVRAHALDVLWGIEEEDIAAFGFPKAAVTICITGVFGRTLQKYQDRGMRYVYLEAGAVAHMINLLSLPNGVGSTIVGSTQDQLVEDLLGIDGSRESFITSVALGCIKKVTIV